MPIKRTYTALAYFFRSEFAGGFCLFIATVLAMLIANSNWSTVYEHFLHVPVGIVLGKTVFTFSTLHFINDGLMAIFFLLVGMEIKRELVEGELSSRAKAMLPVIAAVGGMVGPALIYAAFNLEDPLALRGWAIPTATDIAFSLGVLSLLGRRVPVSLKVFLLAVAVIDDLGAIAIIALFYTDNLAVVPLLLSLLIIVMLVILNRYEVCVRTPYLLLGIILWVCILQSGVHTTLAGVITAFVLPLRVADGKTSPLPNWEHDLHALVTFGILPVFAFANAGVNFTGLSPSVLFNPLSLGIMLGLPVGKVIGITGTIWVAVKYGVATLPRGCSWLAIISLSLLCGIGFTVSLFIGNLAFADNHAEIVIFVKLGVLSGSAISGLLGYLMLRFVALSRSALTDK